MENMQTAENRPVQPSYGLGWRLCRTPCAEAFFKEGHDVGWRNDLVAFENKKIGIVIMTNGGNGEGLDKDSFTSQFVRTEW
jgi:hypothetical protein